MVTLAGFASLNALETKESSFSISGDCGREAEVGFAVGVGVTVALIATPLFHTNLVPDLTQVNFFPPEIEVAPAFTHFEPALTAANAEDPANKSDQMMIGATSRRSLRMSKFKPWRGSYSMTKSKDD
jgi:hypothetical protein